MQWNNGKFIFLHFVFILFNSIFLQYIFFNKNEIGRLKEWSGPYVARKPRFASSVFFAVITSRWVKLSDG